MKAPSELDLSQSQILGALSRGPRTGETDEGFSLNALRHGLSARINVLVNEDRESYENLLATLRHEFQPRTEFEEMQVEEMAVNVWRLRRFWAVSTSMVNENLPAPKRKPGEDNLALQLGRTNAALQKTATAEITPASLLQAERMVNQNLERALRRLLFVRGRVGMLPSQSQDIRDPEVPGK